MNIVMDPPLCIRHAQANSGDVFLEMVLGCYQEFLDIDGAVKNIFQGTFLAQVNTKYRIGIYLWQPHFAELI